jgi:hypothetical protein
MTPTWVIPRPIERVFGLFPLKVNERVDLKSEKDRQTKLCIYVYSFDETGICNDPQCLQAQSWSLLTDSIVCVKTGSSHVSPTGCLPYIVDYRGKKPRVLQSVRGFNDLTAQEKVHIYAIEKDLRTAWLVSLLDSGNSTVRNTVYMSDMDRKLPTIATRTISTEITEQLIDEISVFYPQIVSPSTHFRRSIFGFSLDETTTDDIFSQANTCLEAFDQILHDGQFLGLTADHHVIGKTDIVLFSYVYLITKFLPDSRLCSLITDRLRRHAEEVYHQMRRKM